MLDSYMHKILVTCLMCAIALPIVLHFDKKTRRTNKANLANKLGYSSFESTPAAFVQDTCSISKRHFVFVKTHKTGSSTITRMLEKYITSNNISKAKMHPKPFVGGYPGPVNFTFVKGGKRIPNYVEAITEHLRFDSDVLRRNMPEDTVYFTILRNPWSQFQSSFHYYNKWTKKLKPNCFNYPNTFVRNGSVMTATQFLEKASTVLNPTVPWYFRAKNYQAHDLGFDPMLSDEEIIKERIDHLEKNLNLVMITEYFDMSMILLKDLMCLSWEDIVYENRMRFMYKKQDLNANQRRLFHNWNNLDVALYQHFNSTFWRKVKAYGEARMRKDVEILRNLLNQTAHAKPKSHPRQHTHILYKNSQMSSQKLAETMSMYSIPQTEAINIANYMRAHSGGCGSYM